MSDVRNIGARISTNPVATVRPIEGTSLFPLGQLVEAKVAAILADGLFKFISSDGGEFELPLPEKLPEGTPVRVSTKPDGSVTVTVTGEAPDQSEAMIAAALKEAVRSAAAKQATMSPLFATLEELPDRPDLPQPIRQAVQTLLSMRTPLDLPPRPAALAQAVARSGLFTEAQLATSPDIPPPLDLKVALSSLRAVVQTLVDAMPPATVSTPAGPAAPVSAAPTQASPPTQPGPGSVSPNPVPLPEQGLPQARTQIGAPLSLPTASLLTSQPQTAAFPISAPVPQLPAAPMLPSLPVAQPPAVQVVAPSVAVPLQGVETITPTAPPQNSPTAPAQSPQAGPAGQGMPMPTPQAIPMVSTQIAVQSQPPLPQPGGVIALAAPPEADVPSSPQTAVVQGGGSSQQEPAAPPIAPRVTLPAILAPLPAQSLVPTTLPADAEGPAQLPTGSAAPPPAQAMTQSSSPRQAVLPSLLSEVDVVPPPNRPVPGPLVRAATLALAQAAALPVGEPVLTIPGQQTPTTPSHLYPTPQRPDAPPPTHGSPPVSHALVDAHDVARAAAQTQPLEEIAPRLLADTDAAISRVSLHQMASLPDDHATNRFDAPDARWSCEIPIALDGRTALMGFVVERDGKKSDDPRKQKRWRVQAALDLPETGPLQADVQMRGRAVVAGIWVERSDIAQLLEEALPQLRDGLTAAGFDVETLNVRLGHLSPHLPPPGAFLDQRS